MWNLPGPGIEPVSPALAGRFFSTVLPGKPLLKILINDTISFPYMAGKVRKSYIQRQELLDGLCFTAVLSVLS